MPALRLSLDVPEADRPARLYAAEELLRPLGLTVESASREALREGDLYVGDAPEAAPPTSVRIRARSRGALGDPREIVERDALWEAFEWLSGSREAAVRQRDRWGRVPFAAMPEEVRADPLATPVDDARLWLAEALRARGVTVRETTWDVRDWAVALTHDLDALRTNRLASFAGDVLRRHPVRALRRALGADDRRRSARALAALAERHGAAATFFAKAGTSGREDVRVRPEREAAWLRRLLARGHEVGLHPSIQAATDPARLGAEADRLARATGERPALVRSHFLRWDEPVTPAIYARAGFHADSTLGWSEAPGFRRGTAYPFRLWDARAHAPSGLWELPLAVMDTTLFVHRAMTEAEAAAALAEVFAAARQARGLAVVLWHNAMDGDPAWWRKLDVLDRALGQARSDGATLLPLGRALSIARRPS